MDSDDLRATFQAMLDDWTNAGYDPFRAPQETAHPFGRKSGRNPEALGRVRVMAKRMVGLPDDAPIRTDESGYPVNRMFADVEQDEPEVEAEPGCEGEVQAFNLFAYLSRSDVTWNPSVCTVLRDSLFCPTSEEFSACRWSTATIGWSGSSSSPTRLSGTSRTRSRATLARW